MAQSPENVNTFDQDEAFWQKYLKGRPQVPDKFFERIFAYHSEHGGSFGTVHDAGAGVGVHSTRLAKRFDHVLVTDPAEQNIVVARGRLGGKQYEFEVAKLEDTANLPPASMDMVFCGVMLHFTDLDRSLAAVAHQLKPGGTFVACCFGLWELDDETARAAWTKMRHQKAGELLRENLSNEPRKRIATIMTSEYDAVPLSEEFFKPGALRVKLNWLGEKGWYNYNVPAEMREHYPYTSHIGPEDVIIIESEEGWSDEKDMTGLKGIVDTYPRFDLNDENIRPLWDGLKSIVGDRKMKGHWPAVLILATRK